MEIIDKVVPAIEVMMVVIRMIIIQVVCFQDVGLFILGLNNKIDSCKKFFLLVIPMDPITKTWKFKYDDERDPLMKQHTKGYYLNVETT